MLSLKDCVIKVRDDFTRAGVWSGCVAANCNQFTGCIFPPPPWPCESNVYAAQPEEVFGSSSHNKVELNPLCTWNAARRTKRPSWKRKVWRRELITKINTQSSSFTFMHEHQRGFVLLIRGRCLRVIEDESQDGSPCLRTLSQTTSFSGDNGTHELWSAGRWRGPELEWMMKERLELVLFVILRSWCFTGWTSTSLHPLTLAVVVFSCKT